MPQKRKKIMKKKANSSCINGNLLDKYQITLIDPIKHRVPPNEDFWNYKSQDNEAESNIIQGLKDSFLSHFIIISCFTLKRLFFIKNDYKVSCEFESCDDGEKFLRSFNTYLSYIFLWDIYMPVSLSMCQGLSKKQSKRVFYITFSFMTFGNCLNWFILNLNNYDRALAFSAIFDAAPAYLALLLAIGFQRQLKCVIVLFVCNVTFMICFYLILKTFQNIESGTVFQFLIFFIENLYSNTSKLPLDKLGWHAENFVLYVRVYAAWFVGLKLSGVFLYAHDLYEIFKYLSLNCALTIFTHSNAKSFIFAYFYNKISRKAKLKTRVTGRGMGQKLYFGTFFEANFFYVSVLLYFYLNEGGIVSIPGIDLDKMAKLPEILVLQGSFLWLVFFFALFNEIGKYAINSFLFRSNKQVIYYRIKNFKLRLCCDFASYICAYYALLGGYAIQINQHRDI